MPNDYHNKVSLLSPSPRYHFPCVRTHKICSFSNFQVQSTMVLTVVTMLYITPPEHIHLITGSLYSLTTIYLFSLLPRPPITPYFRGASFAPSFPVWAFHQTKGICLPQGAHTLFWTSYQEHLSLDYQCQTLPVLLYGLHQESNWSKWFFFLTYPEMLPNPLSVSFMPHQHTLSREL